MSQVTTVEIEVSEIIVGPKFFSFQYGLKENGVVLREGKYEAGHVWEGEEDRFMQVLKDRYATELVAEIYLQIKNVPNE